MNSNVRSAIAVPRVNKTLRIVVSKVRVAKLTKHVGRPSQEEAALAETTANITRPIKLSPTSTAALPVTAPAQFLDATARPRKVATPAAAANPTFRRKFVFHLWLTVREG